jgi:hypothetical protein
LCVLPAEKRAWVDQPTFAAWLDLLPEIGQIFVLFARPTQIQRIWLMPIQTETLSIRISRAELVALRKRARDEKVSMGKLVRQALANCGIVAETSQQSGYYRIKHLVGRMHGGPANLSTNPKHLVKYGA